MTPSPPPPTPHDAGPASAATASAAPTDPAPDSTIELEVKLAVRSHAPESVMEALAGLRHLPGGFRLEPRPTRRITDHYLTLPAASGALGGAGAGVSEPAGATSIRACTASGGIALRRRRVETGGPKPGSTSVYTLKGVDPRGGEGGISARFELERPDDPTGRGEILEALAARGVVVANLDALPTMQVRETLRHPRTVHRREPDAPEGEGTEVAELVLDTVTLALSDGGWEGDTGGEGGRRSAPGGTCASRTGRPRVRFHEVEIERTMGDARGAEGGGEGTGTRAQPVALLESLRDALLDAAHSLPLPAGSRLVPWPLSKLETGLRIEGLLAPVPFPAPAPHATPGVALPAAPGGAPGASPASTPAPSASIRDLRPEELDRLLLAPTPAPGRGPGQA